MLANTALSPVNVANEVDRYIAWPGQALGYMIGRLRIRSLREERQRRLGPRFEIRDFHDAVLRQGAMPLDVLEAEVRADNHRPRGEAQPRPRSGISVAITVMNCTFASRGRLAM
jgi:hypothetical protein